MRYYGVAFEPEKNGGYIVRVPDIPEVATQGDSLEEAMEMAEDAIRISLEEYAREGRPIPDPTPLPRVREKVEREDREMGWETPPDTLYQMVHAPDMDRTPVKVTISMPRRHDPLRLYSQHGAGVTRFPSCCFQPPPGV